MWSVSCLQSTGNVSLVSRLILDAGLTSELVKLWNEQKVWVPKPLAFLASKQNMYYFPLATNIKCTGETNKYVFLCEILSCILLFCTATADVYSMYSLLSNWARFFFPFLSSRLWMIWSHLTSETRWKHATKCTSHPAILSSAKMCCYEWKIK